MSKQSPTEKKKQPPAWLTPEIALQLVESALAYCDGMGVEVRVTDGVTWAEIVLHGIKAEQVEGAWKFTVRQAAEVAQ